MALKPLAAASAGDPATAASPTSTSEKTDTRAATARWRRAGTVTEVLLSAAPPPGGRVRLRYGTSTSPVCRRSRPWKIGGTPMSKAQDAVRRVGDPAADQRRPPSSRERAMPRFMGFVRMEEGQGAPPQALF